MDRSSFQTAIATLADIPQQTRYPTVAQLQAWTQQLVRRHPGLARSQVIGTSRAGEPIEMLSIGGGPKSALLVGAPHPNEPVGCLSIQTLAERLCGSAALRAALPFRWHFIPAIEPDALRLNEGWFDRPDDLAHHLRHYFRPAFVDQAEYGFAFASGLDRPVGETPENAAYRAAIDIARPDLLCPLHNAMYGGSFFLLSRSDGVLAETLSGQPATLGLGLNTLGELTGHRTIFAPGVFQALDVAALVTHDGSGGDTGWPAGDSASNHVARRGGLALIPEVAPWDSDGSADLQPAAASKGDVLEAWRGWCRDVASIGEDVLRTAAPPRRVADGLIRRAVEEQVARAAATAARPVSPSDLQVRLRVKEHRLMWVGARLITLRNLGLIGRLAASTPCGDGADACESRLAAGLVELRRHVDVRPVPIARLITAQLHAVIAGAATLAA